MLLKHIFSNINIPNLLTYVKKYLDNNHFLFIQETIQRFLACSINKSFIVYQCPSCGCAHKFKISCNSRLYPACGKNMLPFGLIKLLLLFSILNIELYFLPFQKKSKSFFFYNKTLLTKLAYTINDIFKYQFNNIKSKNQRVHKIGRYSKKYFTDSDIIHYGLISVVHTFGRDLK